MNKSQLLQSLKWNDTENNVTVCLLAYLHFRIGSQSRAAMDATFWEINEVPVDYEMFLSIITALKCLLQI